MEKKAIKSLRSDDSIVIAKADRGYTTVILNRDDYYRKMQSHLEKESISTKLPQNNIEKTLN